MNGVYLLSTWENCGGVTWKVPSILFSFHLVATRYVYKVRPFLQTPVIYPVEQVAFRALM
jgi:hypothetical protein